MELYDLVLYILYLKKVDGTLFCDVRPAVKVALFLL